MKNLPFSKDCEMMVLGSMLTSINALNHCCEALEESDFYVFEHQLVFSAMKNMYLQDRMVNLLTTNEELSRLDNLPKAWGPGFVVDLAQFAGIGASMSDYTKILIDKSKFRKMVWASQNNIERCFKELEDVDIVLDETQKAFFDIGKKNVSFGKLLREILDGTKSEKPFLKEIDEKIERYKVHGDKVQDLNGVPSGFYDLDLKLNGLGNSNLIILAARPAMGKTAFALNIAGNVAFQYGRPVGIFSLEMSADQLTKRLVCFQSRIPSDRLNKGNITEKEYKSLCETIKFLEQKTIFIDDQSGLKLSDLKSRARRMKEAHGIELLVIDYLQLLSTHKPKDRVQEVSEISRELKNIARELNIPVLCLSQLSRKVEERQVKKPMMSDLRESGSIEQDADVVAFIYRREYYDESDHVGEAEIIIGKNRHGEVGTVTLSFIKEIGKFESYVPIRKILEDINDPFMDY